ncbi:MAG: DUF711 family protein [Anaerolineaceae bacterium]
MKIRSITVFCQPGYPPNRLLLEHIGVFARHASSMFTNAGFEVQSCRLATPPFPTFLNPALLAEAAQVLSMETHAQGFEYLSLGPALTGQLETYEIIPEVIAQNPAVFLSGMLTTQNQEVSLPAAMACARVVEKLAGVESNGFANLRFSALANVLPFAPFFPAAYGESGTSSFALAIEGADLAVQAFSQAATLAEARHILIEKIESNAQKLESAASKLSQMYGYSFRGLDFTLAPFPEQQTSITNAMETLGLPVFGMHGSLFASAFLTDTLDRAHYTRAGFNGLMLPVLEDAGLAQRAAEGHVSVADLLLFSSVCGTGLDVLPLPGSTSAEKLYPVLLDLAALALRLKKPLTARLMPIPGKQAGDLTAFDFEYFANSRILALPSFPLSGILKGNELVQIQPRQSTG